MSFLFCILALSLTTVSLMRFAPFTQRRQVKRVYFNYYHHLNLDCHIFTFINTETGISLLLLCLAVCLPKADGADSYRARKVKRSAELEEILKALKNIHTQVVNMSCDNVKINSPAEVPELRLYTPADVTDDCFETAFNCFISELWVIDHEYKLDCPEIRALQIIFRNVERNNNIAKKGCLTCEEFQEKSVAEFLKAFETLVQKNLKTGS
ncbi:interleukin-15-like isoform X2 [Pristis pectinata]|uniref:interleukin-15-like isoform X2 n=1 Tax=Pristis pectinata TaxID=685728 RepID=UPI00223D234D|nr:interleukin-15-like isoform X2 [Pristis pectinata]